MGSNPILSLLLLDVLPLSYYRQIPQAFSANYLSKLQQRILACPYFSINNLNRDFVGTKGFSVVFRRSHIPAVEDQFPYFKRYLDQALQPDCNAFYLNPLQLQVGSRVDPHIDRSLRSYCKTIDPPDVVSVLYVSVPEKLVGGELVLRAGKTPKLRQIAQIQPEFNTLLFFQGDLTHSVNLVQSVETRSPRDRRMRLSLVCEQYQLEADQLLDIPEFTVESRMVTKENAKVKTARYR